MNLLSKIKNNMIVKKEELPTIAVRDLKDFLVKDFEQIQNNEIVIKNLKNEIERLTEIEIKYKATLITLEEYDARILREKNTIYELEDKIKEKNKRIKELEEEKNNCLIREKQANDKINNAKDYAVKEIKKEIISKIKKIKGNIGKTKIIEMIESEIL